MDEVLQRLVDALSLGSITALVALGVALIAGILGLVNFAHGDLLMVAGYSLLLSQYVPFPLAIVAALLLAVLAALAMERLAFRPLRGASPATLLIASFALSYLIQNAATIIFGGRAKSVSIPSYFEGSVTVLGARLAVLDVITLAAALILLTGVAALLRKTRVGVAMRAASEDFRMARLVGIHANRVIAVGFLVSGLLAGIAGILLVARTGSVTPDIGFNPLLLAFVAVVIGGIGSLSGAVAGGYILGVLTTIFGSYVPVEVRPFRDAFVFALVIFFLVFLPNGLRPGSASVERV